MEEGQKKCCFTSCQCGHCHIFRKAVFGALTLFLLTGMWGILHGVGSLSEPSTMDFSGFGEVVAGNTVAQMSFSFSDINDDVTKAREVVSGKVDKAYAVLKKMGVADKDIQTTRYNIYPEYDYVYPAAGRSGRNELSGYRVSHTTNIRIRDLEKTGLIIDAITAFKPTNVDNLSFTLDEKERKQLEERALALAINDAKDRARRVAKDANLRLKDIVGIRSYVDSAPYPKYGYERVALLSADTAPTTPIAQGEDTISVSVTITYKISD